MVLPPMISVMTFACLASFSREDRPPLDPQILPSGSTIEQIPPDSTATNDDNGDDDADEDEKDVRDRLAVEHVKCEWDHRKASFNYFYLTTSSKGT